MRFCFLKDTATRRNANYRLMGNKNDGKCERRISIAKKLDKENSLFHENGGNFFPFKEFLFSKEPQIFKKRAHGLLSIFSVILIKIYRSVMDFMPYSHIVL